MKRFFNINTLLICAVALIALGGFVYRYFFSRSGGTAHVNFSDGRPTVEISLSKDGIYNIDGNNDIPVTLQVENNSIRFIDSKCPDHICEGYGYISNEGETAICMPAGVAVLVLD